MNNYFNEFEKQEQYPNNTRALPAWAWIVAIVGLIISIVWGYSVGTNTVDIINMGDIPDETPDSFDLGALDFTDSLYVFGYEDRLFGYNLIDYPSTALYYNSTRDMNDGGGHDNVFVSNGAFSVEFMKMNAYDIPCVFSTGAEGSVNVNFTFESNVTKGNLEARLVALSADYQTEQTIDGYIKIKAEYIQTVYEFKANESVTDSIECPEDVILVLIVACESASGAFEFSISV